MLESNMINSFAWSLYVCLLELCIPHLLSGLYLLPNSTFGQTGFHRTPDEPTNALGIYLVPGND